MSGEHFAEINALVRAIADGLAMPEAEVTAAFEANQVEVACAMADGGIPVIDVSIGGRSCRIAAGRS